MKGLGVVSRIELAFFLMFIALLVWSFATYLRIGFATITPQSAANSGEKVQAIFYKLIVRFDFFFRSHVAITGHVSEKEFVENFKFKFSKKWST